MTTEIIISEYELVEPDEVEVPLPPTGTVTLVRGTTLRMRSELVEVIVERTVVISL